MKIINFICKNLFFVALLLFATQCKDKDESQPLTMTLYDKPLSTIQSVVEGKWKWYSDNMSPPLVYNPTPVFFYITKDSIVKMAGNKIVYTFYYRWEQLETLSGYTTYVMWDKEQNQSIWYFESIKKDTLFLHSFDPLFDIEFIKIKK